MSTKTKTAKDQTRRSTPSKKVLKDNVQGITKPALKRIMRKSQVERVNGQVFDELRSILKSGVNNLVRDVFVFVEHSKRKTAMLSDFYALTDLRHTPVAIGINKDLKTTKCLKLVRSFDVTASNKRKRKPGKVAQQEIRKAQKSENVGLVIPRQNFSRLVKEVAQDYNEQIRIREDLMAVLQSFVEQRLVEMCNVARLLALHDGDRKTLMAKDLQLARTLSSDWMFSN